jgi:hypothetical protein
MPFPSGVDRELCDRDASTLHALHFSGATLVVKALVDSRGGRDPDTSKLQGEDDLH